MLIGCVCSFELSSVSSDLRAGMTKMLLLLFPAEFYKSFRDVTDGLSNCMTFAEDDVACKVWRKKTSSKHLKL